MGPRPLLLALALVVGTTAAGCGSAGRQPSAGPSSSSPPAAGAGSPSNSPSVAGTAQTPAKPTPVRDLLAWRPIPHAPADGTAVTNGHRVLTVPPGGSSYTLSGRRTTHHALPARFRVSDALLDDRWAVVVGRDEQETKAEQVTVVDLRDDATWTLGPNSDVPTTTGGDWALAGDTLVHGTMSRGRFCHVSVDLARRRSQLGWCAPPRHGWNSPVLGPDGEAMLTFDDHHPSCRTVVTVQGTTATPFPDVPACKGAEGALLGDGAVWSVVPNEHRFEEVEVYARTPAGYDDLGPGVNGTLTRCGDAVYWAADPATDRGKGTLMRWDGRRLAVVYESGAGAAVVGEPFCAGSVLSVSSDSNAGSEQVSAHLPR